MVRPRNSLGGLQRPTTTRLQHTALKRRIPLVDHIRPVGRRLPTVAYPRKSGKNRSQGPVIHRPHPHRKHSGISEFQAGSPRRGRPQGHRLGRNAVLSAFGQRKATGQVRNRGGHHTMVDKNWKRAQAGYQARAPQPRGTLEGRDSVTDPNPEGWEGAVRPLEAHRPAAQVDLSLKIFPSWDGPGKPEERQPF